jgi:hypothetical protein
MVGMILVYVVRRAVCELDEQRHAIGVVNDITRRAGRKADNKPQDAGDTCEMGAATLRQLLGGSRFRVLSQPEIDHVDECGLVRHYSAPFAS